MANPAVTYSFSNSTVADASQVNQNFTDIINGITDATKDLSISALTAAGNVTLTGTLVSLGASSDLRLNKLTASQVLSLDASKNITSTATLAASLGGSGIANSGTFTWGSSNITFTTSGTTSLTLPTSGTVATTALTQYQMNVGNSSNVFQAIDTSLIGGVQATAVVQTFTVTLAAPGVFTLTGHGYSSGQKIYLTTTGALPTGLTASTAYWVFKVDANSFKVSSSLANLNAATYVTTSGSQSGTHSAYSGALAMAVSSMDAVQATQLGKMIYLHGTNYAGAVAPTVTLSAGGGTLTTVNLAQFRPYQTLDTNWHLQFNINVILSATTRTTATLNINGVTFLNVTNTYQAISAFSAANNAYDCGGYAVGNTGHVVCEHTSISSQVYTLCGDVVLDSKPTWAY